VKTLNKVQGVFTGTYFFQTTILVNGVLPAVVGVLHQQRNGKNIRTDSPQVRSSVFHSGNRFFIRFTLLVKTLNKVQGIFIGTDFF
jgi:hypothetical protein